MAATVEGIFRIIDRASGPMQRMERQARQTDRAIKQLGMTTDNVGTTEQQRRMANTEKAIHGIGSETDRTTPRVAKLTREMKNQESMWTRLKGRIIETGAALTGLVRIFAVLKLPVIGAAVGVLAQAIGALGGGIISLVPQVADLSGAMLALGPTVVGIGLAMVTTKLAFSDFGKALGGNKNALKALTPEARAFLVTVKQYAPVLKELRASAQSGLFGGLDIALRRSQRALPVVNTLLRDMSRRLGDLAAGASRRFTTPGFLQDLLGIGQAGGRTVTRGGQAIINLVSALRHLTAAAIPFTDWMGRGLVALSKWVDRWALFQRDSGNVGRFLDRTKESMRLFGRILKNVWEWLGNLLKAARPLGELLWKDAERATAAWAKMTGTVGGQLSLMRQFLSMRGAIREIVTLVDDLVRAVFHMGSDKTVETVARGIRLMIPSLQRVLTLLAQAFGPPLIALLTQATRMLEYLAGATGPLSLFLQMIADILKVVNDLIDAVPGLGRVLTTALSVAAVGLFITKIRTLAATWWSVATGARAAAAAEALALGGAGAARGAAAVAGGGLLGAGVAGAGAVAAGRWVSGPGGAMIWEAGAVGAEGASVATGVAASAGIGSRLLRGGKVLGRVGRVAGKFAWPVTAAFAGYDAATANVDPTAGWAVQAQQRADAALSGATFGLYKAPLTANQAKASAASRYFTESASRYKVGGQLDLGASGLGVVTGQQSWRDLLPHRTASTSYTSLAGKLDARLGPGGQNPQTYGQLSRSIRIYRQVLAESIPVAQKAGAVGKAGLQQLRDEIRARTELAHSLAVERAGREQAQGYKFIRNLGSAWNTYSKSGMSDVSTTERTNQMALAKMKELGPAGRRVIADRYIQWLNEEQKQNPKLKKPYQEMVRDVKRLYQGMGVQITVVNGDILRNTTTAWKSIQTAMTGPAEQAREQTMKAFTDIQNKAVATLTMMGFEPAKAKSLVKNMDQGGVLGMTANWTVKNAAAGDTSITGKATGGRIAGGRRDGSDSALVLAGRGELVVNRHTERAINAMLGGRTTLDAMVAGEHRAHGSPSAMATGGRAGGGAGAGAPAPLVQAINAAAARYGGSGVTASDLYGMWAIESGRSYPNASVNSLGYGGLFGTTHWNTSAMDQAMYAAKVLADNIRSHGGNKAAAFSAYSGGGYTSVNGSAAGSVNLTGGGMGGGMGGMLDPSKLFSPSNVPGVSGLMATQAMQMMATGLASKVNSASAMMLGGGPGGGGGGGGPGGVTSTNGLVPQVQRALAYARAHGWTGTVSSGYRSVAEQQYLWDNADALHLVRGKTVAVPGSSSHNFGQAVDVTDYDTFGQIMASAPPGSRITNAVANDPVHYSVSGHSRGGRIPWYGNGADFVATRPQIIGVGDGGHERVTVTPAGKGSGRGIVVRGPLVHVERIENYREGDIHRIFEQELEKLAKDLEDGMFGDNDGVLS